MAVRGSISASVAVGRALRAGSAYDGPERGRINEVVFGGVIKFFNGAPVKGITNRDNGFPQQRVRQSETFSGAGRGRGLFLSTAETPAKSL